MGARDLFGSRRGAPAVARANTEAPDASTLPTGAADARADGRTSGVLLLAAARSRLALGRATDGMRGLTDPPAEAQDAQAVCTCGSLISRVSSLLGGRDAATCERCRFFGHYSQ